MAPASRLALAVGLAALLAACQRWESVQATRDRATEAFLTEQIADLRTLITKAETGQLVTQDRIAVGIDEDTVKALLDASLPQEGVLGERVRVRVETAQPLFRGNNAALVFQASARGQTTGAEAHLELAGRLVDFRIEKGKMTASVELAHFKVLDSSLTDVGSDILEGLVRDNMGALARLFPRLELPVSLEQSIAIAGLDEGVVVAKPGELPLEMTVAEVIPVDRRLWILLDVKAGPWRRGEATKTSG